MNQAQVAQQPAVSTSAPGAGETMTSEPVEPKKGGWLKWVIIALVVLFVGGGLFYWLFV